MRFDIHRIDEMLRFDIHRIDEMLRCVYFSTHLKWSFSSISIDNQGRTDLSKFNMKVLNLSDFGILEDSSGIERIQVMRIVEHRQ